jgi:hypothetical protein
MSVPFAKGASDKTLIFSENFELWSSLIIQFPSCSRHFTSAPYYRTQSVSILNLMWQTSFHTHNNRQNYSSVNFIQTKCSFKTLVSTYDTTTLWNTHSIVNTTYNKVTQSYYRSLGSQEVEVPRFLDNRHMKVVRLSALRTGRLYPPGKIPGTHFC